MDLTIKENFLEKWSKYFPGSDLPIACYYSDELNGADFPKAPKPNKKGYTCIFSQLASVRQGKPRAFNQHNLGCFGANGTLGFTALAVDDDYVDFLVNVEKFKKNREFVECMVADNPYMTAPGKYLVCKRWDLLSEADNPQVVIVFANADAIGGLHTLANFDYKTKDAVISPFGSGCDSIIGFAMKQVLSGGDKCVLGLFDPPARTCIKKDLMTFSMPYNRLKALLPNLDECFLNTYIWDGIRKRMAK